MAVGSLQYRTVTVICATSLFFGFVLLLVVVLVTFVGLTLVTVTVCSQFSHVVAGSPVAVESIGGLNVTPAGEAPLAPLSQLRFPLVRSWLMLLPAGMPQVVVDCGG